MNGYQSLLLFPETQASSRFSYREMAQLLSTFYRTTLNKGDNMILVSDEILNIQSYMSIQLIMHSNSFEVEYQIDEEILEHDRAKLMYGPEYGLSINSIIEVGTQVTLRIPMEK